MVDVDESEDLVASLTTKGKDEVNSVVLHIMFSSSVNLLMLHIKSIRMRHFISFIALKVVLPKDYFFLMTMIFPL